MRSRPLLAMCSVIAAAACARPAAPTKGPAAASTTGPKLPFAGELGTAHPMLVASVAPDGHYVVFCQARADTNHDGIIAVGYGHHGGTYGDALSMYLATSPGAGEAIDDFVDADPLGLHIVIVRGQRLVLVDTRTGTKTDLGQQARDPRMGDPFGGRAASFDDTGAFLVYLRPGAGTATDATVDVVVRDLASATESVVDVGNGKVWKARFIGAWLAVDVVETDTDHNGKIELPRIHTTLSDQRCRGRIASYGVYGRDGDTPVMRIAPRDGGVSRVVPDLLLPVGTKLLRRLSNAALVLEDAGGTLTEIASSVCAAKVLGVDTEGAALLLACSPGSPSPVIHVDAEGRTRQLPWTVSAATGAAEQTGRFVSTASGIADIRTGAMRAPDHTLTILLSDHVVAVGGGSLWLAGPSAPRDILLSSDIPSDGFELAVGDALAARTNGAATEIFDLARPASLGRVDGAVLGLTRDGAALVLRTLRGYDVSAGPAHWVLPTPKP